MVWPPSALVAVVVLLSTVISGCVEADGEVNGCSDPSGWTHGGVIVPAVAAAALPDDGDTRAMAWRLADRWSFNLTLEGDDPAAGSYPVTAAFLATPDALHIDFNITIGPYLNYGKPDVGRFNNDRFTIALASVCDAAKDVHARAFAYDLMHEHGLMMNEFDGRFDPERVDQAEAVAYPLDTPLAWTRNEPGLNPGHTVESWQYSEHNQSMRVHVAIALQDLPHPDAAQHSIGFHLRRHDVRAHEGVSWQPGEDPPPQPGPFDGSADFWPGAGSNPDALHNSAHWWPILLP